MKRTWVLLLACALSCSRADAPPPTNAPATQPTTATAPPTSPVSTDAAPGPTAAQSGPTAPAAAAAVPVPADWHFPLDAPFASGAQAAIASDHALATQVGRDVLADGGNAVDAAVATAFALAVVLPSAGNVGGGGFLIYRGADGTEAALDFREAAPGKASRDMFLDRATGKPTDRSRVGHQAAGVPGSVAGLWAAHQRFGSKPWADLVAPAIALARTGFAVGDDLAESVAGRAETMARYPATAALYLPGGKPLSADATLRNPDLAATLERIARSGPDGFYRGPTAHKIVAEMKRGRGLITAKDLAAYRAKWRDPVRFTYRGHQIISMPPPSSGGLVLALMAGALERQNVETLGWHSGAWVHRVAETMRRAYAARNELLGDPDFVAVPSDAFTSTAAIAALAASIDPKRATPSAELPVRAGTDREGSHTTHFSVVDRAGNAVALTTTLNTGFGAQVVVGGAGFFLNNEMDDFAAAPGQPNLFGLVQGEANAIAPGKRMLSSMTPTIAVGPDGTVRLVTGAAGGPTITTAVLNILLNTIDHGMDVGAAVAAPRVHHQHLPDALVFERGGLAPEVLRGLEQLGHHTRDVRNMADAPTILRRGDRWTASAEPRRGSGSAQAL